MFSTFCRICLSDQSDNVTVLFQDVKTPSETGQMYIDCLRLELVDNKNYPKHICNYCKLQLSVFHNFMMMAKRSYDKFTKSELEIKSEKVCTIKTPEVVNEPFDQNKSVLNSRRNSEAEYLDTDIDEDPDFSVSAMDDTMLSELTENEDNIDDCIVEYLDDDDVLASNIKNEIIEVKDEQLDNADHHDEDEIFLDDEISYNSEEPGDDEVLDTASHPKSPTIPAFYQLEMLDGEIVDEEDTHKITWKTQRDSTNKDYGCKQCNSIFSSVDEFRAHYTSHPECKLDCEVCGKRFKTRIMYQSHMNVHNGLPAFKCEMCDKTFNFRSNYQTHKLLHTNERPYPCSICDKGFRSKWDLIIHTRVHNDIRKYECKVCGKRFRVSSHLTAHQYTHAEEKLFECDLCLQRYNSPRTLKQHKNTVHSNNFRFYCSQCDKKFKRKHHVVSHLKTHFKHNELNMNAVLEYRDEL